MDTKRERKRISRATQYWLLPNESEAYSTSNESIRAQDSLVHIYVFIHESHVPQIVRKKKLVYIKRGQSCVHWILEKKSMETSGINGYEKKPESQELKSRYPKFNGIKSPKYWKIT